MWRIFLRTRGEKAGVSCAHSEKTGDDLWREYLVRQCDTRPRPTLFQKPRFLSFVESGTSSSRCSWSVRKRDNAIVSVCLRELQELIHVVRSRHIVLENISHIILKATVLP